MSIVGWMSVLRQIDSLNVNKFECNGKNHQRMWLMLCLLLLLPAAVHRFTSDTSNYLAVVLIQHGLTFKRHVIICKTMLNAILSILRLRFSFWWTCAFWFICTGWVSDVAFHWRFSPIDLKCKQTEGRIREKKNAYGMCYLALIKNRIFVHKINCSRSVTEIRVWHNIAENWRARA